MQAIIDEQNKPLESFYIKEFHFMGEFLDATSDDLLKEIGSFWLNDCERDVFSMIVWVDLLHKIKEYLDKNEKGENT